MNQAQTKPQTKPPSYALLKSVLDIPAEIDKDETEKCDLIGWILIRMHY